LRRVKDGKAMGVDGIPEEMWKYGGYEVEEWIWEMCNRIWRGGDRPEDWKERVLVPIMKKGQGMVVKEYRRVTVMSTLYKIYSSALTKR